MQKILRHKGPHGCKIQAFLQKNGTNAPLNAPFAPQCGIKTLDKSRRKDTININYLKPAPAALPLYRQSCRKRRVAQSCPGFGYRYEIN